jgi:hypothetical protein
LKEVYLSEQGTGEVYEFFVLKECTGVLSPRYSVVCYILSQAVSVRKCEFSKKK